MNFKGVVARVCGVDLDPRVKNNPYLDEGRMTDAANKSLAIGHGRVCGYDCQPRSGFRTQCRILLFGFGQAGSVRQHA